MAKPERGLPKSFDIRVPDGPVRLGDYLDEPPPAAAAPLVPAPAPAPVSVPVPVAVSEPSAGSAAAAPAPQPRPSPPMPPPAAAAAAVPAPAVSRRAAPPRKQFNMAPETLRMLDELLLHIRAYSAERDVRASELMHALVMALHEVRPYLDLTKVPPRGKWGSPGAAALPVALKKAFQDAVAKSRHR